MVALPQKAKDTMAIHFGVYDHMDASGRPLADFYEDRLRLAEAYDRLGYEALHIAEHHSTPLGLSPSPSVFLSSVAQRTKRLRFGPLVYTLNLYHPLRLAEEICMLDQLSRGRFLMGVGRGISPFELGYYGGDPAQGHEIYVEALAVIRQYLTAKTLTHEGKHFSYRDVPVEVEPFQKPEPPLWYGIGTADSVVWCAENKANVVANGALPVVSEITKRYRAEWVSRGNDPASLPMMGVTRHMVVAPTDEEAMQLARRAFAKWGASYFHLFKKHNAKTRFQVFTENFDEMHEQGLVVAGAPSTVRRNLEDLVANSGVNYVLCRFAFGDITYEESLRSAELCASEVIPAFR
jgi:alkanesulfonate monooxygenase SsuD/methylene tetrahydromethanopterin reductase-like flavin-dependent oxidoreductase (luciferase family)